MKYINLVLALGVSFINAHGSFQSYCTGEKDSCDDTLCCAIGTNGFVEDYQTHPFVSFPIMSFCNYAPVDGASRFKDIIGTVTGSDSGQTRIIYRFPADGFSCIRNPKPPGPPPVPPHPRNEQVQIIQFVSSRDGDASQFSGMALELDSVKRSDNTQWVIAHNYSIANRWMLTQNEDMTYSITYYDKNSPFYGYGLSIGSNWEDKRDDNSQWLSATKDKNSFGKWNIIYDLYFSFSIVFVSAQDGTQSELAGLGIGMNSSDEDKRNDSSRWVLAHSQSSNIGKWKLNDLI